MTNAKPILTSIPRQETGAFSARIKHTRIAQVIHELDTLIYPGSHGNLFLICGPSGVGKTTLSTYLVESTLAASAQEMGEDAGLIPAVYVEARSCGDENGFNWKLFYIELLECLNAGMKLPRHTYGVDHETNRLIRPSGRSGNSVSDLRLAVERALKDRGVRVIYIDEAAHIFQNTPRSKLSRELNTLKSLVNRSGAQIVLIGSYDLYDLMSLSGQIARRTHVIHFERYREDSPEDIRAFRGCVKRFQDARPHVFGDRLLNYAETLQENTLGCIGTLHDVLARVSTLSAEAGGLTDEIVRRCLLTEAQRNTILQEILDGEAAIKPGLTRTIPKKPPAKANSRALAGAPA